MVIRYSYINKINKLVNGNYKYYFKVFFNKLNIKSGNFFNLNSKLNLYIYRFFFWFFYKQFTHFNFYFFVKFFIFSLNFLFLLNFLKFYNINYCIYSKISNTVNFKFFKKNLDYLNNVLCVDIFFFFNDKSQNNIFNSLLSFYNGYLISLFNPNLATLILYLNYIL